MSRFSRDRQVVEQVVLLKDEPDRLLRELDPVLRLQLVGSRAREDVLARPALVEQPEDREQRRLSGAGGPHDRHELAGLDLQVDAAQDEGLPRLGLVALVDVPKLDHRDLRTNRLTTHVSMPPRG